MKLLADNDAMSFLCCSAIEEKVYQLKEKGETREEFSKLAEAKRALNEVDDPDNHEIVVFQNTGSFKRYVNNYRSMLDKVMATCKADEFRLYSEVPNSRTYRHELAFTTAYKNRPSKPMYPRPLYLNKMKQWCVDELNAIEFSDIEADDALCIVQTGCLMRGEESIIAQNDKDILQCQGKHFRLHKDHRDFVIVEGYGELTELKKDKIIGNGSKFFFVQMMWGDVTDTYGGLKGYGPKKVWNLLLPTTTYEEGLAVVEAEYRKVHGDDWYKHFLEQGRLAWMLRTPVTDGIPLWDEKLRPHFG